MPPWIGITTSLDARGRWRAGRDYHYLDAAYAGAVAEAGGVPVLLPVEAGSPQLLDRLDALLVPGGDDFAPPHPYPPDVRFELAPPEQVAFDLALLARALERGLPLLGICYGMQLLALHAGGALHHHLPLDAPRAACHQLPERDGRHALHVEDGSRLAAVLGTSPAPVNSLHHQAVASPGAGLRVSARAPDGVIEAVEDPASRFCVGVQWHPEKLEGPHRQALFGAFVQAAAGRPATPEAPRPPRAAGRRRARPEEA